ncbi:hypothetical protein QFZ75_007891 [Streptomyces sp. V3I8]|uniref:hypothetical protein n=1 Tax=Streptomyces sp. V3I8 TaxID=3042279 RepID=UPI0027858F57|nr:hypothetical protein [Streptomyces sp. V3I8]MDQ1041389.1 hypothetical protein [Streptomyces sp. V3I8]
MSMSDNERRLLFSGTLDTSGIGGGPHEFLAEVSEAWGEPGLEPEVEPEPEIPGWSDATPDGSEHRVPEKPAEPAAPAVKQTAAQKRAAAKKAASTEQAPAPADS